MRPIMPFFIALLIFSVTASAEPVVVVNARSGVERLSRDEVISIFLGRYRRLPTGVAAIPVDQPESSALRAEFYRKLVGKDLNEINAYWSRLIFSGKTSPPRQTASASEVVSVVSREAGGIAYIERGLVDSRFRIVLEFP